MPETPIIYGFSTFSPTVLTQAVATVDPVAINDAIDAAIVAHTADTDILLSLFASNVTDPTERYLPASGETSQPLDTFGRPLPVQGSFPQNVAYPLQRSGSSLGLDWESSRNLTVLQLNNLIAGKIGGDSRWMRDHIIAAMMAKGGFSYEDEKFGSLAVQGLANADGSTYNNSSNSDPNHYLAQANDIDDASGNNNFRADYDLLMDNPENGGSAVAFVSRNLVGSVENLSDFKPLVDVNVRNSANEGVLVNTVGVDHPGKLIGYVNGTFIVDWNGVPNDTIITVATEGDRALGFRQSTNPALQGFIRAGSREDHPYYETIFRRIGGFGVRNRVGALVRRVGMANYAVPANMVSPKP